MGEKTPRFPLGPVLVLFGFLGLFLIGLLAGQPRIPPATPIPPTVVAVVPTTLPPTAVQAVQAFPYTDAQVKQGRDLFEGTCVACHGPEAQGIPGLGKNLTTSTFVHGLSDDDLVAFIAKGRQVGDPLNTTGVAMPARGGNPSLTDDKLRLIIAFLRSQQVKYAQAGTPAPTATPAAVGTEKPFVLPIESLGIATAEVSSQSTEVVQPTQAQPTAQPTTQATESSPATPGQFVLPIESLGIITPTEAQPAQATEAAQPTQAPTAQATESASAATQQAGQFVLPIESLGFVTPTPGS